VEYLGGRRSIFDPFGGPMNGQTARLELAEQILSSCKISRIVETGTYRGTTTVWFAKFGLPVMTVEVNPQFAEFSRLRLKKFSNVEVRHEHSIAALGRLAAKTHERNAVTFFYLDAHWAEDLPLREEVEIITENFPKAVIMIDDFEVPDDPGYGFDDYGRGQRLSLDLLSQSKAPTLAVYFPSATSDRETGEKRGSVTVTVDPGLAVSLDRLPSLRRWIHLPASDRAEGGLVRGD
jgi:predicted O-methyltransferase YrrM